MVLTLVTPPASEPITTDAAKLHLHIDHSDEDDAIEGFIAAAREYVETGTQRKCLSQTLARKLNAFPCSGVIWLPFPPVSAVSSISYIDTNGDTQVLDTSVYTTFLPAGPKADCARISLAYQQSWPQTRDVVDAVTIQFVCGYANPAAVPPGMVSAMKLLIDDFYRNGEPEAGASPNLSLARANALIWQYRVWCPA